MRTLSTEHENEAAVAAAVAAIVKKKVQTEEGTEESFMLVQGPVTCVSSTFVYMRQNRVFICIPTAHEQSDLTYWLNNCTIFMMEQRA